MHSQFRQDEFIEQTDTDEALERCELFYLEGVDNSEVVTLGISRKNLSPHVCHLLFTLTEEHTE